MKAATIVTSTGGGEPWPKARQAQTRRHLAARLAFDKATPLHIPTTLKHPNSRQLLVRWLGWSLAFDDLLSFINSARTRSHAG